MNPVWEKATFNLGEFAPTDTIEIQVWDKDRLTKDDFMGRTIIPLKDVNEIGNHENWYPLEQREKKNEEVSGDILLRFETRQFGLVPPMFGVELELLNRRENCEIPSFIATALDFISSHPDDTIFSKPPASESVNELKTIIDAGAAIHWGEANTTVRHAGALLQLFLRELPTPLMTTDLTRKIILAGAETEEAAIISKTRYILAILPESHAVLLRKLICSLEPLVDSNPERAQLFSNSLYRELVRVDSENPLIATFLARIMTNPRLYVPKPIIGGLDDHPHSLQSVESTSSLLPGENSSTDLSLDSEAYKLFISYDIDQSNSIDRHEFGIFYTEFLNSIGRKSPSSRDLKKVWGEVTEGNDTDQISWEEFARWWRSLLRDRSTSFTTSASSASFSLK